MIASRYFYESVIQIIFRSIGVPEEAPIEIPTKLGKAEGTVCLLRHNKQLFHQSTCLLQHVPRQLSLNDIFYVLFMSFEKLFELNIGKDPSVTITVSLFTCIRTIRSKVSEYRLSTTSIFISCTVFPMVYILDFSIRLPIFPRTWLLL